jgi:hypothetical protein
MAPRSARFRVRAAAAPALCCWCIKPDLAHLVRCKIVVDAVEGFAQVVGERVGGGEDRVPAWISMVR